MKFLITDRQGRTFEHNELIDSMVEACMGGLITIVRLDDMLQMMADGTWHKVYKWQKEWMFS